MWLHRDLGWWGLLVGVLGVFIAIFGIFATIPVTVLGNLITPYVQNLWAARSRLSLQKRIADLEIQLAEMEALEPVTTIEIYNLRKSEELEDALLASVHLVLVGILLAVLATTTEFPSRWVYGFAGWMVYAMLFNVARSILQDRPSTRFRAPDREVSLKKHREAQN